MQELRLAHTSTEIRQILDKVPSDTKDLYSRILEHSVHQSTRESHTGLDDMLSQTSSHVRIRSGPTIGYHGQN